MKKLILFFTFIFIELILCAQQKGATTIVASQESSVASQNTYAVVVGISDYQDPSIPDLKYADKDAEAFANFLRSNAGGRLDNDHLKLLLNKEATVAQFAIALDWLMEVAKENDHIILYFSGHGDVEKKTITQPGYLLCWDAPSRVYLAGGSLALPMFQDIITTLSTQNKAKVVVITDACRSGKLAGSSVGGSQITGANLAKQLGNEIKIMSCQPNEYSIEGQQWGGGRGAFSFHLLDALYGMADINKDSFVTLQEVGRYLEDHVTNEVAPVSQVPFIVGNRSERLTQVDEKILASIKSGKSNQNALLSYIDSRGIEEDVLSKIDSNTKKIYALFKMALENKNFLPVSTTSGESLNSCAETYYQQLIREPNLERLYSTIKRNYAAALQDDAQQTLNAWLRKSQELSLEAINSNRIPQKIFTEKVKTYPSCLDRAAELLGSSHYMYSTLKARKYFFEGYLLANSNKNLNPEIGNNSLNKFRQSLQWQPEQPHVYWQMSNVFGWNFINTDSLEYYALLAHELYPNWFQPLTDASFWYSFKYKNQNRAKFFLDEANRIDSNSTEVMHYWAVYNFGQKKYSLAEEILKKVIVKDSLNVFVWTDLGYCYYLHKKYDLAESALIKAISIDSTQSQAWNNLGVCYNQTRRFDLAESVLRKALAMDSTSIYAWNNLGNFYNQIRQYDLAEKLLKKAVNLDSTYASAWNNLGVTYNLTKQYTEAEVVLNKAILLDSTNASAFNNLGNCYMQTLRYIEAEPVLKKSIGLDSNSFFAWNNIGYCYLQSHRYEEAKIALLKAIAIDSTVPNPFKHLGMVYWKLNRYDDASQQFLYSIKLNPNYTAALLGMAYLLDALEKTEDSAHYVEQAIVKGVPLKQLEKDEDLASFRSKPEYRRLVQKYFPNQQR